MSAVVDDADASDGATAAGAPDVEPESGAAAGDDAEPAAKKARVALRKPQSSYMLFCADRREQVRREHPGTTVGDQAKVLGELWKALPDDERKAWNEAAAADKERYERERADFVAAHGADALDGGADGDDAAIAAGETAFPLAKIKRIVKLDPDVKNITKEATALIAKASELFVAGLVGETMRMMPEGGGKAGRKHIKPSDVAHCIGHKPQLEWLREDFPPSDYAVASSGRGDTRPRITEADAAGSRRIDQMFQPKTALLKAAAAATDADARDGASAAVKAEADEGAAEPASADAEDEEDEVDEEEEEEEEDDDAGAELI